MRKKIVAGNWKMNKTFQEAENLIIEIADELEEIELAAGNRAVILCPPFVYLELATDMAPDSFFSVGAQNMSDSDSGAFTGEISGPMLKSMEVEYCIIGHSERRKYFGENNELLARKVDASLSHDICPIFCCGELLPDREAGKHFDVVKQQLEESLFHLKKEDFEKLIIAYEPVWAIGTGVNATPEQAQEMHAFIRKLIAEKYGEDTASQTSILYGGSCNAKNAQSLFAQPDVDGGLIGGASLNSADFIKIINSF
ncbi:MAG: triose-phosphate isomerase [Bacteroidota bacterium]|nr:triose-phosphate isomerase [Bacteroidota bacterium]